MNNTLQFNDVQCIQGYEKLGSTVYVDICNNETYKLPWGIMEWFTTICLILFVIFVITSIINLFKEGKNYDKIR